MTVIEKILSTHSDGGPVTPGRIVTCDVDRVVMLDLQFAGGPVPLRIHDPARISVVLDHAAPAPTVLDATSHQRARRFAAEFGIADLFDMGRQGISHQLVLEHALALPGQVMACADSHTCASGVLNCAARGLGHLEILQIVCTGQTWYRVPETVLVEFAGDQATGHLGQGRVPGHGGRSSAAWRGGRSSSPPQPGAALDRRALDHRHHVRRAERRVRRLPGRRRPARLPRRTDPAPFTPVAADADARYAAHHVIDLSAVTPRVATPGAVPGNTVADRRAPRAGARSTRRSSGRAPTGS